MAEIRSNIYYRLANNDLTIVDIVVALSLLRCIGIDKRSNLSRIIVVLYLSALDNENSLKKAEHVN